VSSPTPYCLDPNSEEVVPCGEASPDAGFLLQDGSFPLNPPNLLIPPDAGVADDLLTGLEWRLASAASVISGADAGLACGDLTGDWRLPTVAEALSLLDYGTVPSAGGPYMINLAFDDPDQPFWTSDIDPDGIADAYFRVCPT
jgi:hypothetical protein